MSATATRPTGRAGTRPAGAAGPRPPAARQAARATTPEGLAAAIVVLFLEVESGLRPRRHVTRLMCPMLLARTTGAWVRPGPPGVLVRMHVTEPAEGVCEAAAVVRRGSRYGALGVRLARRRGRWRIEALDRPEDRQESDARASNTS